MLYDKKKGTTTIVTNGKKIVVWLKYDIGK